MTVVVIQKVPRQLAKTVKHSSRMAQRPSLPLAAVEAKVQASFFICYCCALDSLNFFLVWNGPPVFGQ